MSRRFPAPLPATVFLLVDRYDPDVVDVQLGRAVGAFHASVSEEEAEAVMQTASAYSFLLCAPACTVQPSVGPIQVAFSGHPAPGMNFGAKIIFIIG
uniref:hypothetical protein n=1 Tax=Prevotella denticola TaxID=28129 RepID=UPI0035CA2DB9